MKRDTYIEKLEKWCSSSRRKPLILEGARQVGKTWLMREFARTHFANVVYARFDKNVVLKQIFDRDFDVERILRDLEVLFHTKIDPANTILLFDEIQACRNALTSLKYFCEDRPDIRTEIDFILQCGMSVVPLEVKAEENVRSQSLKSYERRFLPSLVLRASMLPYIEQVVQIDTANICKLHNFPLYAVSSGITSIATTDLSI